MLLLECTGGSYYFAPIVAEFGLRHPAVRLRLTLCNARVDLNAGGVDLVVRTGELPDSSLKLRRLATAPFVVVASPACLSRHGTPTTVEELVSLPCIALDRGGDTRWCAGALAEPIEVEPIFVADDNEVLRDAAIAGLGFALIPKFAVAKALDDGRLVTVTLNVDFGAAPVYLVFPGHKVANRCASALADAIIAAVARDLI